MVLFNDLIKNAGKAELELEKNKNNKDYQERKRKHYGNWIVPDIKVIYDEEDDNV